MARCVMCGKEFKNKIPAGHLKSHKVVAAAYDANAATLGPRAWEFYWTHPGVRAKFVNPTATVPAKGMQFTFKKWFGQVGLKKMALEAKAVAAAKAAPKAKKAK